MTDAQKNPKNQDPGAFLKTVAADVSRRTYSPSGVDQRRLTSAATLELGAWSLDLL